MNPVTFKLATETHIVATALAGITDGKTMIFTAAGDPHFLRQQVHSAKLLTVNRCLDNPALVRSFKITKGETSTTKNGFQQFALSLSTP